MRAGFFPDTAARYQTLLAELRAPQRIKLVERKELGDDRVYQYRVEFGGTTLRFKEHP